jgi:hypothetical protein
MNIHRYARPLILFDSAIKNLPKNQDIITKIYIDLLSTKYQLPRLI